MMNYANLRARKDWGTGPNNREMTLPPKALPYFVVVSLPQFGLYRRHARNGRGVSMEELCVAWCPASTLSAKHVR
jgi:hypothetical protein